MKSQKNAPLLDALRKYANQEITHFDVPGHKKRNNPEIIDAYGEKTLKMDANSTPELDLPANPTGVIAQAEQLLADAYWADQAFLLVNGSTAGVQYMILTACGPNDKIIMPRNVHKSAINALILCGARPVFIEPEIDCEFGINNGVRPDSVKKAIQENPDARAVFLINPTYFGATSDLREIVKLAHRYKMTVLVDESHGAHFPFHPDFPVYAMDAGADMATISLHKTGGSLTQSSALLLNERVYSRSRIRSTINLLQTTSASYLLMSSIDLARRKLSIQGEKIFGELLPVIRKAKQEISQIPGLAVLSKSNRNGAGIFDYDETKFVIRVNDLGLTGFEAYELLRKDYGIQPELAETYVVLAIASIGDDAQTIRKLVDALRDLSTRFYGKKERFSVPMKGFLEIPRTVLSPRDAHYSSRRSVSLDEAVGEICGESIMIYPPGIPLAIPGERLTEEIIEHYKFYQTQKCVLMNDDEHADQITILG
ncbi:MAG TPA: aminotransferase class I/II-fold pyridoxal phosphate-dependent enzyme [Clostridia bacterium]|nr:aminotransferase class I/II-fold pyridoxal phosphate-dependent enzyme [Clostridia bacterium]